MLIYLFIISVFALGIGHADIGGSFHVCKAAKIKYTVIQTPSSWTGAYWDCQERGLQLVTILSQNEEDIVEKLLASYQSDVAIGEGFWTAANAGNGNGSSLQSYRWYTTGQFLNETYQKFHTNQPDHVQERCVNIFKNGNETYWNNHMCDVKKRYICQTRKNCCSED